MTSMPAAVTGVGGIESGRGVSEFKIPKPGEKSPGFLFPAGCATNGGGRGFLRFPYSNVDERPLLGTFAGTSKTHTMTNTTFLRSLLAAATLAALPFGATISRAATGDIFETNEGNLLRFKPIGGTPTTFATGFTNPKGLVF